MRWSLIVFIAAFVFGSALVGCARWMPAPPSTAGCCSGCDCCPCDPCKCRKGAAAQGPKRIRAMPTPEE